MKKGFTILELLIAISLISVMTGVLAVNYSRTNKRAKVEQVTAKLRQKYIQARNNSLSGKKDCSVCGGADNNCDADSDDLDLQGWRVAVNAGIREVTVDGVCSRNIYPGGSQISFEQTRETMPTGVNIAVSNSTPILFRTGGKGIYPQLSSSSSITVTVSDADGNSGSFTIDGSGRVQ